MQMTIRPATGEEAMYTFSQSSQLDAQTGCIGHLRADMDTNGNGFFSSWEDHCTHLKTDAFKEEFDDVINTLRFGKEGENGKRQDDPDAFLKGRKALADYCKRYPSACIEEPSGGYGFRADTEDYTYMMRLDPQKGEYNLYCYCYKREFLQQHLENAARGIRFIDSRYHERFRIPDGGRIRILYPDRPARETSCRYIDDTHMEVGYRDLFHICEFAERLEKIGAEAEPIDRMQKKSVREKRGGEAR